jgi:CDP-paratose 2-epimerase
MKGKYLITGGAGFIGCNYVSRLVQRGEDVTIFDNLSRSGSRRNLEWLRKSYGDKSFALIIGDVRDSSAIRDAARTKDIVVHLAAQVAVTTSVINPREDFEINAIGTFNTLEAARLSGGKQIFLYSSTNKVYGEMKEMEIVEQPDHFCYADHPKGISEIQSLDFHSPYGCSKGCGDQYVRDYHRIYDLPTAVFRQSCIYGTRQFGVEDQGWVAWFVIAALTNRLIKIYGNGKQVRDLLYIDDLLDAYDLAIGHSDIVAGEVFNIGGGNSNAISIHTEFFPILEKMLGKRIQVEWGDWRPGDQKIYVSDIQKAFEILKWKPKIGIHSGLSKLFEWVKSNKSMF